MDFNENARGGDIHAVRIDAPTHGAFASVFVRMRLEVDDSPELRANARLIAAAPEMYEALELAFDGLETYAPDYMHGMSKETYIKKIRAALSKARGEI